MVSNTGSNRYTSRQGNFNKILLLVALATFFAITYPKPPILAETSYVSTQQKQTPAPEVLSDDLIYSKNARSTFVIPVSIQSSH